MHHHTNLPYQLSCHALWYGKPNFLTKLLQTFPTWSDLQNHHKSSLKIKPEQLEKIAALLESSLIKRSVCWLDNNNHHFLTIHDAIYPERLKEISHPPPCLFGAGDMDLLNSQQIAVVGTRKPTPYGKNQCYALVKGLNAAEMTITSGLACGIDTFAHQCTLQNHGRTIAVIGNGIDKIYPSSNRKLYQKIQQTGCLISEYPLGTPPRAHHFPQRNRLISGLSLGTLVVEARLKSGSLITAKHALQQNREVFAVPGLISNPEAEGCHYLIKSGAKLVDHWADIIVELPVCLKQLQDGPIYKSETHSNQAEDWSQLSQPSQQWLTLLKQQGSMSEDEALMTCNTTIAKFMQIKLECELLGLIRFAKGRYWYHQRQ